MSKRSAFICDCTVIHKDVVQLVQTEMRKTDVHNEVAKFFQVIGDYSRYRMLAALAVHELCVCDLSVLLNNTKSAISHQLKVLKEHGIIKSRKEGKNVYYSLDDEHIVSVLGIGKEHIEHKKEGGFHAKG